MSTRFLRSSATAALFALLYWRLDIGALADEFADIQALWVLAALALTVPQVVLSAWRWRLTARQIGLSLPLAAAIREYYLATFLNQILPGGVLGDATRAWRHAQIETDPGDAWHAVVIERASGQLSLGLITLIALAWSSPLRTGLGTVVDKLAVGGSVAALVAFILFAIAALCVRGRLRNTAAGSRARRFIGHTRDNLLSSRIGLWQFVSSLLVVASYVGVFLLSARAIGVDRSLADLWALAPLVLLAMAIPLSIAGWGLREGAAALVWMLAGLPASEGVAVSLTYGAIVLLSSLPGAAVLIMRRRVRSYPDRHAADA